MVIAILWFLLRSLVMTGVGFAYQQLYGEHILEETLEQGYVLRSASHDDMPQYQVKAHSIQLSSGVDYRFVFLAQHKLTNVDLKLADSEGEILAVDDPMDQDGSTFIDFSPSQSGLHYLSTEIGNLGGADQRTESLLFTFIKTPVLSPPAN